MKKKRRKAQWIFLVMLLLVWLLCSAEAWAGALGDRLGQFPNWHTKPPVQPAEGDLFYPDWLLGTWDVETTLVDLAAPLEPEIITPGFESNRDYLNQPVPFQARFVEKFGSGRSSFFPIERVEPSSSNPPIIADRAFNGLNLAKAYLGDRPVKTVKVDPDNPNRQITLLRGDRQLVSTVVARATESERPDEFLTSEIFQQEFRGAPQVYFNTVETTTTYQRQPNPDPEQPAITADQVTAIYLSSQDPDYFKAGDRPVALYRYHLDFRFQR